MFLQALLALFLVRGFVEAYYTRGKQCPIPSICGWGCDYRRKAIDCSGTMLGPYSPEIPDKHDHSTWSADFSYNTISTIQNMAFYVTLVEVIPFHSLNYSHNEIRIIEPHAFQGLDDVLHTLDLNFNQLETVPAVALGNLTRLKSLSLSNNKLISLDFICSNSLPRLHKLNVGNNSIAHINPTCFYETRLGKAADSNSLILRGNKLRYLDVCTFQNRRFETLDYSNNSLICLCSMSWLSNYKSVDNTTQCHLPQSNRTMSLTDYFQSNCDTLNTTALQCVEMVVNATYVQVSYNESQVQLKWRAKDFPDLRHLRATLYSFNPDGLVKIGHYKIHSRGKVAAYTIIIAEDYGSDLLVCLEASERNKDMPGPAPLTFTSGDSKMTTADNSGVHVQCQRVWVPGGPAPLVGALRSSSATLIFTPTLLFVAMNILTSVLVYS